jgi:2-alkenal reductase
MSVDSATQAPPYPAEPLPPSAPYFTPPARRDPARSLAMLVLVVLVAAIAGAGGGYLGGYLAGSRSQPVVSGLIATGAGSHLTQVSVADSLAMIEAVKRVDPAVVTITTTGSVSTQGGSSTFQALGTGVIFDSAGHILTNQHVVENGTTFTVLFAQGTKKVDAHLVGTPDKIADLAVLKVDAPVPAVAQFGASRDLQPGQQVLAIGSALGDLKNTVTAGVVSAVHRNVEGTLQLDDMIQTDAPINHGNSGGPLVDLTGQVIGINTAIAGLDPSSGDVAQGIGFAIPSDRARDVALQIVDNGFASHPYIGVSYHSIDSRLAAQDNLPVDHGALVRAVTSGSPADKAGLRAGDILISIDGTEIDADNTLSSILGHHSVGDKVKVTIMRGGSRQTVTVTLAQRPSNI